MAFWKKFFGSSEPTTQPEPMSQTNAPTVPSRTAQSTLKADRLTYEMADDFSAILQYCSAKKEQGKEWPNPTLLRQLRELLREAPVRNAPPSPLKITRQLPALWKNREDLIVTENLKFESSVTGDFQTVVDEIMDQVGRAEKSRVFVSLHHEADLGVTVNCHVLDGVFSLLVVKLPSSRFALYSCMQQTGDDATQSKTAAAGSAAASAAHNRSPLARLDPSVHHAQQEANGRACMQVENYRDFLTALKSVPALDLTDPRLPSTVDKTLQSFSKMLGSVEFYLGQSLMNDQRITIKVRHDLFVYATNGDAGWPHEWEIAKINDDGYLVWNFAHDPTAKVGPLFSDQLCAFRIGSDGTYSCSEKAVTVCPDGLCLFHMKKGDVRVLSQRIGGVLWDTFQAEYKSRLKERVESGIYDFRGFEILPTQGLAGQNFPTTADFRDATFRSVRLDKSVFESVARFDRAIFDWTVSFDQTVFKAEVSFSGAKFQHHGGTHPVSFKNTVFEGPVDFSGTDFTPEETGTHDKPFQSVQMETAIFKAGLKFDGATGVGYVKAPEGEPSKLLQTQGMALPPMPSPEKVAGWRKELASVREQLFKDPAVRASWWKQKADLETAIFEDQVRRGEDAGVGHLHLGYACFYSGNLDAAKQHFQKCLELQKDSAEAMLGLARCELWWARTNPETEQLLLEAVKKSPKLINVCDWPGNDLNLWVGAHYMRAGDPGRAVAYLRRAVELNPKGSMVNEYLGRAYLEAGYPEDAITALEREVAVAPSRYDPHIYLDPIYAARGNGQKSVYHRDQANYNNPGRLILGPAAVQEIQRLVKTPKTVPIPALFEPPAA